MSDKFLFEELNTLAEYGAIVDKKYPFIDDNLNPKLALREYQKQAFNRFYFYFESDKKPNSNVHLAYHMATGSGKTVVMAGLILYLYEQGYRNFLFFVNRGQIVEKTKDNFINQQSNKYLFNDKIIIDNKQVELRAVDNFSYSSGDDINICFTTIQGLFSDFHNEKENALTLEDFKENKIALIADEAHHINASTKKQIDWLKPSWENTVETIFKSCQDNILLEFSATIELDNKAVREKYLDKIIYQYDLQSFVKDGFSKKIDLFKSDTNKKTRIGQALIASIYREQVAIKYGLNIKPVVLFKSAKIAQSIQNQVDFHKQIENLSAADLASIKDNSNIEVLQNAFKFFIKQEISLNALADKIKHAFDEKKCLCTNNDKELELNQKRLNNLEDNNNAIRAIFSVDKLNEGWDVLNLFDIVRLYEGQSRGGSQGRKISNKTVSEAQLVGRGARYCPFIIKFDDDKYRRKFDDDIKNELRILEELYFHSSNESQYISEIKQALIEQGLMDENGKEPIKLPLKLKDKPKLANKLIFKNKRREKSYKHIKNFADFGMVKTNFNYDVHSGKGALIDVFDNQEDRQKTCKNDENFINLVGVNIVKNAILSNDFFSFANLKKSFPNLSSINEFISSNDYMAQLGITISNKTDDLQPKVKLNIALSVLNILQQEIKGNTTNYQGTKEFNGFNVGKIFNEKTLLIPRDKQKTILDIPHDWFVFEKFYGTSEEKSLIELIARLIKDMQSQYSDIYLMRNERHFALYDFEQGRRFEPDFVLLAKSNKNINYQFFIEPKGRYLQAQDKWKQDFLLDIKQKAKTTLEYTNQNYKIIGLEFYNKEYENSFKSELSEELSI